jgi:hypothetical protein
MAGKLKKHARRDEDDDAFESDEQQEREIDPRWESLKNLQIEEDN